MASKSKLSGLNGTMHAAGIFSDMTVDGPEIGTLVVIVDRAKNLPNRKTIGKQDPYCAARLGKEAKKTETDRRGGQTPRWDQELRFKVHDSPDYYQLKVSVFNDDKKTDLIGETWVDLKEVVVPGGGQNDLWHNLSCKSKYAGEIRIEITYYDTRPKQEKPEKTRQGGSNAVEDSGRDSLKGPRQPKGPLKRRPLPSDPITGAPAPLAIPDHVQTPPRYPSSPTAIPEHVQTPPRGYQTPPSALPDHLQASPRGYQSPNHIPNQSPLQSVEYSTPPSHFSPQGYESPNAYGPTPGIIAATPTPQPMHNDRYEIYDPRARNEYAAGDGIDHYDNEEESVDPRDRYDSRHVPYELPQPEDFGPPPSPGGPPPPPPAHRSRNGSSQVSPAPAISSHGSYGFLAESNHAYRTPPHEEHRHSMPTYGQHGSYQTYNPENDENQFRKSANASYQQSPPRHHSYDSRYNADYSSMQPSVEDVPSSPVGAYYSSHRSSTSRAPQSDDRRYDEAQSPAPLNLSGRGSSASGRTSASNGLGYQYSNSSAGYASATESQLSSNSSRGYTSATTSQVSSNSSMGYTPATNSQLSYRDAPQTDASVSSRTSYNSSSQQDQRPRELSQTYSAESPEYGLPPLPPTLVAGMDPLIAQEISDRIYDEKRAGHNKTGGNSARGRYHNSPQYQPNRSQQQPYQEVATPTPFVPAAATYDERQSRFSTATVPIVKPRAISPDPPRPMRKSVSPSPTPSNETRRLSGVPFGPDSYNSLNPSVANSNAPTSMSAAYDTKEVDPDAKIITHDGREVDPSDHIPESNYAPLLEQKGPKYASQMPDRNYRPPPAGQQSVPTGSRMQLRQAGRPQSMVVSSPSYINSEYSETTPPSGRNRLQKKANRMSAQPAPGSSPLAPVSPYQDNSFTPRGLPRASTGDFNANENYAPNYGGSNGYRGTSGPPPIPAKVPVGVNGPPPTQPTGGDAWALLEEMKNIDLGTGRARRRGY